ncbi:hypothetical protein NIES4075_40000 [Tolypothrix sp. NIES-4075]|nr:hypothetical protein NIES4075_40000 [Tolypothrix sp. NIES-4075]
MYVQESVAHKIPDFLKKSLPSEPIDYILGDRISTKKQRGRGSWAWGKNSSQESSLLAAKSASFSIALRIVVPQSCNFSQTLVIAIA